MPMHVRLDSRRSEAQPSAMGVLAVRPAPAPAPAPEEMTRVWEAGAGALREQQPAGVQNRMVQEDGEGDGCRRDEGKGSSTGDLPSAEHPLPHAALDKTLGEAPQAWEGSTGVTLRVESLTDTQAKARA